MNTTPGDLPWLASMQQHAASLHKAGQAPPRLQRVLTVPPWGAHHALVSPFASRETNGRLSSKASRVLGLPALPTPPVRDNPHPEVPCGRQVDLISPFWGRDGVVTPPGGVP